MVETPIRELPLCFLDLETTGAGYHHGHRIVEVGVCRLEPTGEVKGPFARRVNPGRPISFHAGLVHGIRDEAVAHLLSFRARAPKLAEFCQGSVLVAHGAKGTDEPMLRAEFEAAKVSWPFVAAIDTLPLCRRLWPDTFHSLVPLAKHLGIDFGKAHSALGDVETLLGIWGKIRERLPRDTPLREVMMMRAESPHPRGEQRFFRELLEG